MNAPPSPDEQPEDALDALLEAAFARSNEGIVPGAPAAEPPTATETIEADGVLGRYRILGELSRGGMGIVLRALDTDLQREVAIKRLLATRASDQELIGQFEFEARTAARLQHPGIVPVYDFGRDPEGRPYFVMQIIGGQTLSTSSGDRDHAESLELFHRVCDTVAFAHDRGIVHGDLKPANVMVGPFNEVQVLDWGFARGSLASPLRQLRSGATRVFGTPAYMAPEQACGDGDRIDTRTDVFNLGAMLCELLTGAPPYLGDSDSDVLLRATKGWLDDARDRLQAIAPDALVAIVMACLAIDPTMRPPDAGAVADRIHEYRTELRTRARTLELEAAKAQAAATQAGRARRLTVGWALTAVALIAVAAVGYASYQHNRSQRTAEATRIANDALAHAELAGARADTAAAKLEAWAAAVSSAERAEQASAGKWVPEALARRARGLVDRFREARRRAEREQAFTHWLAETRPHLGEDRAPSTLDRMYQQAFENFGLIDGNDTVMASASRAEYPAELRRTMTTALDEWAGLRQQLDTDPAGSERLIQLADTLDRDPVRRSIRAAYRQRDVDKLRSMAKPETLKGSPAETVNLLAKFLRSLGALDEAVDVLRHGVAINPGDFWLCHDLSSTLRELTPVPWPEAIRASWMALAVRPRSVHALVDVAVSLVQVGDYRTSDLLLERALSVDPDYVRALECAGSTAMKRGDHPGAVEWFQRALVADSQHHAIRVQLAKSLVELGRLQAATKHIETVLAGSPEHAEGHALRGKIAAVRGDFRAALDHTRRAADLAPESLEVMSQLGTVCYQAYLANESVRVRRRRLDRQPDHPAPMCDLGLALLRAGELEEGLRLLQAGHERGTAQGNWPNPTDQWIYLARYLISYAHRLDLIVEGKWAPQNSMHRIGLADAHLHLGNHRQAAELYAETFAADPGQIPGRGHWAARAAGHWVAELTESGKREDAARWRTRALGWLRQDLELRERQLTANPGLAPRTNQDVGPWSVIPGLESLRPRDGQLDSLATSVWNQRSKLLGRCNQILDRNERAATKAEPR